MSTHASTCSDSSGNVYVAAALGYNPGSNDYMGVLWKLNSSGTTQWKKFLVWAGPTTPGLKFFSVRMDETDENILVGGMVGQGGFGAFAGLICKFPADVGPTNGTWTFDANATEFPSGFADGTIVVTDYSGTAGSYSPTQSNSSNSSSTYYWDNTSTTYPDFTMAAGTTVNTDAALT